MNEEEMNKKINFWKATTLLLSVVLILSVITQGFGFLKGTSADIPEQVIVPDSQKANGEVNLEGAKMIGDPNAPVIITEYSDFECPFCQRHYSQTMDLIKENYIDTGKVAYVFKHYPLGFHQQAIPAANAAECANEQGKFWEMHDMMFEEGVAGGVNAFKLYAEQLGLTSSVFDDCLDKKKYNDIVEEDFAEGKKLGIKGTPGFIINGDIVSGAQPYAVFASAIDKHLG